MQCLFQTKAQQNFYIPLKLHGSRMEKCRQSGSSNVETEVEKNEQNIENEFLRLFDYARCKCCLVNTWKCQQILLKIPNQFFKYVSTVVEISVKFRLVRSPLRFKIKYFAKAFYQCLFYNH